MRQPKPYYRSQRDSWCVQIGRRQVTLSTGRESEAEAYRVYHRLMAAQGVELPREDPPVAVAIDLYLDAVSKAIQPNTFEQYRIKLAGFLAGRERLPLSRVTAQVVGDWVKSRPDWSNSTRRGAITAVKAWLNWCVREGYLERSPIKDLKRPKMGRRERTVTPAERAAIRGAFADGFGDFLDALTWTGCRPGELMRLEARHLDLEGAFAELPGKTTRATGDLIGFPLIPPMLALARRLAERNPVGPLFRNADGNAWTVNAVRCRMRRLRQRMGAAGVDLAGVTAYTYRHSFATDALERGVPLSDVSALMNHRDVRTTMGYAHLQGRREHLRRQAEKAQGDGPVTPTDGA